MATDVPNSTDVALIGATVGAVTRFALALYGGVRGVVTLAIEVLVGACLGVIAPGVALYWDPSIGSSPFSVLILGSVSGTFGVVGVQALRLLETMIVAYKRSHPPAGG